ncbi:hypothetical protein TSUD_357220 [Trifolium subterraneum]|uniref:Disease resistance protein Roq1-like winged-helix domain-containing protein n=1 Tax=Trifolium subterraneum TaxID=3900 RepID=A0A2Z6MVY5_TRISU|nr:hypothetical protein TSUD_357220 [Trifolium subterraneum]
MLHGRVDGIYMVEKWKFQESLKLFSLGAFKQRHPKEEPIFWESELKHLENNVESLSKIEKVLKRSYDGLTIREKEIFLDIVFFYNNVNKGFCMRILDACGFDALSGIKLLEDKALVTISRSYTIQMHDLLKKLALQIVRYQKYCIPRSPEERSRLRDTEEVRDVFKSSEKTPVEGIQFDLSQDVKLDVQVDTFSKMKELRFLRLNVPRGKKRSTTVKIPEDLMPFPDKLRIVMLNISGTGSRWVTVDIASQGMNLRECKKLIKLPDLSGASKLKWLHLSGCESLCEVNPSVFSNDTLVALMLDRCIKLPNLISVKHLTSLEKIDVYGCSSLKVFSLSSDSIERLNLSNTGTEVLHSSIGGMRKLLSLNLEGLRLQNLPNELSCLRSLTDLRLSDCDLVTKSKLETVFDVELRSLKILYSKECGNLLELPTNIYSLSSLYELKLDGSNVEMLPVSIECLSELYILSIKTCRKLRSLPKLPPHVKELHADNCTSLLKVSTLKTFSESMNGENKYISFKNDIELDESSLIRMIEYVILTMKSAALHNITAPRANFSMATFYDVSLSLFRSANLSAGRPFECLGTP